MRLSKIEHFICELTFGGIPDDTDFILNSKLSQSKMKEFKESKNCLIAKLKWKQLLKIT